MNIDMELHIASKKLINFLIKCPTNYICSNNAFDIFNRWSETMGIQLFYIENVKWAYQYINELKDRQLFDFNIVSSLLE